MPRPTGAAAAEMDRKIAELGASARRPGHDTTVRVRHQEPQRRRTKKQLAQEEETPQYPGWVPREKECRRDGCSEIFLPSAPAQAYHSAECRDEAVRGQRRITDKRKRRKRKEREEAARGGKPVTRECALEGCEEEFVPEHSRSSYHSPECRAEALRKQKRRSAHRVPEPSPDTQQAIAEIDALEQRMGGRLPELGRDYLILLWQRVQSDPACPPHVFDRLERLLGLPAEGGSTMQPVDAR